MPMGAWPAGNKQKHHLVWPTGPNNSALTQRAWFNMAISGTEIPVHGHVYFIGRDESSGTRKPMWLLDEDFTLIPNVVFGWQCPDNTDQIHVLVDSPDSEVAWALELLAK